MLILSRKVDQKIRIGDNITITVIETHSDQVKIGIDAPRSVAVYREEMFSAVRKENASALENSAKSIDALKKLMHNH